MARKLRGLVSSVRHAKKVDKRWMQKFYRPYVFDNQCTNCRFFVPSNAAFPIEWGVCSNMLSALDGLATIATHGCNQYENIDELPLYLNTHHVYECHTRWVKRYQDREIFPEGNLQCGAYRYYASLDGDFITDWGMCTHDLSVNDGLPMFEHDGCDEHKYSHRGWNGPYPKAHYKRKLKYKNQLW